MNLERYSCSVCRGASKGITGVSNLVFADEAVISAESLEAMVLVLEALHEETKPFRFVVSCLEACCRKLPIVYACGEVTEILVNILVVPFITSPGHVKKSFRGLAWLTSSWTGLTGALALSLDVRN